MPDLHRSGPPRELTILRKHQESHTMLAIVAAGFAALFLVAVALAYNYVANSDTASRPTREPATQQTSAPRAPAQPAETTGAGTAERGSSAQPGQVR